MGRIRGVLAVVAIAVVAGLCTGTGTAVSAQTMTVTTTQAATQAAACTGVCWGAERAPGVAPRLPSGSTFRELQMNLCDSGLASCYKELNNGQSVPEAVGIIKARHPDLVTVNEVCQADVSGQLFTALAQTWPGDQVFWVFQPAGNRNGGPYHCANGDEYGIGIVGHVRAADWAGVQTYGGIYPDAVGGSPTQDTSSAEERAWTCAYAVGDYFGCTTHLASTSSTVAFNQCKYLMNTLIPGVWSAAGGSKPSVMGGDLNLTHGTFSNPDVQGCVPSGWFRKGDGDVQHVMATTNFTFASSSLITMHHTDHDAWLVTLTAP
ncbi:MAG TPA: hypothetical protein VHF06_34535 [Pseudonocardiaceae bacterium]|jgi:hypothetical protein|nr:hypothetical protein [Pseudonocardiaceae bacterium]